MRFVLAVNLLPRAPKTRCVFVAQRGVESISTRLFWRPLRISNGFLVLSLHLQSLSVGRTRPLLTFRKPEAMNVYTFLTDRTQLVCPPCFLDTGFESWKTFVCILNLFYEVIIFGLNIRLARMTLAVISFTVRKHQRRIVEPLRKIVFVHQFVILGTFLPFQGRRVLRSGRLLSIWRET